MTIVYYEQDGKVVKHHGAPEMTAGELQQALVKYNTDPDHKLTARTMEVVPGSLIHYLLTKNKERYVQAQDAVRQALDCIDDARSEIESLARTLSGL